MGGLQIKESCMQVKVVPLLFLDLMSKKKKKEKRKGTGWGGRDYSCLTPSKFRLAKIVSLWMERRAQELDREEKETEEILSTGAHACRKVPAAFALWNGGGRGVGRCGTLHR